MELKLISTIEEQVAVRFTGKVNVLAQFNRQYLGHVLFKDGEIFQVTFQHFQGLKAFYHLILQEHSLKPFSYVVEPEVVEEKERRIHFPYNVIKNKMVDVIKKYRQTLKLRPPDNVKILINAEFIKEGADLTAEEFDVLTTLTEWCRPVDIYQNCSLLDHEITLALVNLRKNNALKVYGSSK